VTVVCWLSLHLLLFFFVCFLFLCVRVCVYLCMDVRAYLTISCVSAKDNVKHAKTNIRYESKVNKRNESEICVSQVWRRSEVRNHKRHSLYTRLSSGTSANTSSSSRNVPGRMIRSNLFWYGNNLKMKPTYREKNLLDYLFGGFRSTLKLIRYGQTLVWVDIFVW